ncbi:MAG: NAD-dependent epimerase/dehydratase family protein [Syntrophales bacterium]
MKCNCRLPSLRGKNVLVTGGLGFIGSNLACRCAELGASVTILDCLDPRAGGNIHNIDSFRDDVDVQFHNILDFDQVSERVVGKDVVFNCAASTSHPFSMREPWIDLDVNGRGVINLLEAVRRFEPGAKFIQVGTTTQIGRMQSSLVDEWHPEFPTDIYSANKSVAEKYVLIYANAYHMRAAVIRLGNVYGPRAAIHSPEFTFNNYFIGLALQGKTITVFGSGAQKRNVMYIDDAVAALILASQAEATNGRTLFAVGDQHYSVADIAKLTARHIGGSVTNVEWPKDRHVVDVGDAIISNKQIKSIIKWNPCFDIATGLKETKKFYSKRLKHYLR